MRKDKLKGTLLLLTALLVCVCASACDRAGPPRPGPSAPVPEEPCVPLDDAFRNYYEVYVGSYFDTDNDGIGDLDGLTAKLDYIAGLGYNGIWMMPVCPGTSYHKYDVENYCAIDPDFGTMDDFDRLAREAHKRKINIMFDLVLNHTSVNHPWFTGACEEIRRNGKPGGKYGGYYNFRQSGGDGYCKVPGTAYYYEARFWSGMPDLNLDSPAVRREIEAVMSFWFGHGVDDFRLDAVTSYYTGSEEKNVEFLRWLNETAERLSPGCLLVGEAWTDEQTIRRYYDSGVDGFFLFPLAGGKGKIKGILLDEASGGKRFGELLTGTEALFDAGMPAPFIANHDSIGRTASFMGRSQTDRIKMAEGLLSLFGGSVFGYYGDEIGMVNVGQGDPGKRIAMKWEDRSVYEGWCYTAPDNLKVDADSYVYPGAAEQSSDPDSILSYHRRALGLRNRNPEIARGKSEVLPGYPATACVLTKTYGDGKILIAVNLDRDNGVLLTLDGPAAGFSSLTGYLCAGSGESVSFDADARTVSMPAYSIAIFR